MACTVVFRFLLLFVFLGEVGLRGFCATAHSQSEDKSENKMDAQHIGEQRIHAFYPDPSVKHLTLLMVIEKGLRLNPAEQQRHQLRLIYDIEKRKVEDKFWLPQLNLTMNTSNQRMGTIQSRDELSTSSHVPQGYVGLQTEDYALFNWGRDYLEYNAKHVEVSRSRQRLDEQRRMLRQDLIGTYFLFLLQRKNEEINRDYVKHSTFIYRLAREKSVLRKISLNEYYQARTLYLKSQSYYHDARIFANDAQKELAYQVGDPSETVYSPHEELLYRPLRYDKDEALKISHGNNINILDANAKLSQAENYNKKAKMDNIPLPRFGINFGTYYHSFTKNDSTTHHDTGNFGPGGSNVELRTSINLTWAIWGENGFFNVRKREVAYYQFLQAKSLQTTETLRIETQIYQLYKRIEELQLRYEVALSWVTTARKQFDNAVNNYMRTENIFLNVMEAVNNLRIAEMNEAQVKYDHLRAKLDLVKLVGIEDFPGENFEHLAQDIGN